MKSVKIEIPRDIFDKIKERIEDTEFSSVEEYVAFVLKEVVTEEEEETLSEEEEEEIKRRLRGLGYL